MRPVVQQVGAKILVLAEAHPRQAEALVGRKGPSKGERVLAIAVTGEPVDSVALHVFNNPHFSSLASPTRLGELLPNLRIVEESQVPARALDERSEEHTSELQSLMRISYAVFCLKKKNK